MGKEGTPTAHQIAWGDVPKKELEPGEVLGENPSVPIVTVVDIGELDDEDDFSNLVSQFAEENQELIDTAKVNAEDVVVRMNKKKVVAYIGAGAAVFATAVGILLYKHRKRSGQE